MLIDIYVSSVLDISSVRGGNRGLRWGVERWEGGGLDGWMMLEGMTGWGKIERETDKSEEE